MRNIKLTIVLAFFYLVSAGQNTKAIDKLDGIYIFKDNFCSASYLFKPSGEFFYEGGCEARSNIAKGNYKIDSGKIILTTADVPLQYNITALDNKKGKNIQVTLKDVDGKILSYSKVLTLPLRIEGDTLTKIGFLKTDSLGQLTINPTKVSAISLDRYDVGGWLNRTYEVYHWEALSNFNSTQLSIQFNYPIFCLRYPEIVVTSFTKELQITGNEFQLVDNKNNVYLKSQK